VGSWIAATARNECLRSLAARKRVVLARNEVMLDSIAALDADVDAGLLARLQVLLTSSVNEPQWQDLGLTPTSA
jgi:hypothetical protein